MMRNKNRLIKLIAYSIVALFLLYIIPIQNLIDIYTDNGFYIKINDQESIVVLESRCKCRSNEQIVVKRKAVKSLNTKVIQILRVWKNTGRSETKFEMSESDFHKLRFTCDLFNTLRRGLHQRVVGYSLYGMNRFYYDKIKNISSQIDKLMPGWITRIYYDKSVDQNIICDIECLANETNDTLIDNADFCDTNHLFLSWKDYMKKKEFDGGYIHAACWRWLPIGDSAVDVFSSRDTDSYILQRELDSVNVWLSSDKPGHIMRDHPHHAADILAGMWGYRPERDKKTADILYERLVNKQIAADYNSNKQSPKGADQDFLSRHVYDLIREKSIIHDSYLCKNYTGSRPWPTKRIGDCFVGSPEDCNKTATTFYVCPMKCRPRDHHDWHNC